MDDKVKLQEIRQRVINSLEALQRELGGDLPDCALGVKLEANALTVEFTGGFVRPATPKTADKE